MMSPKFPSRTLSLSLGAALLAGILAPVNGVGPAYAETVSPAQLSGTVKTVPEPKDVSCNQQVAAEDRVTQRAAKVAQSSVATLAGASISGLISYYDPATMTTQVITDESGWVDLYDSNGCWIDSAMTDTSGTYTFSDVAAGNFFVSAGYYGSPVVGGGPSDVIAQDIPTLADEWYLNKPTFEVATPVVVSTSAVTGIDVTLAPGASISGELTDSAGDPVIGADVCAYASSPSPTVELWAQWCGTSDDGGLYVIENVPNGTFKLFIDTSYAQTIVGGGWIGSSGLVATYASAASQTISTTGGSLENRDATLVDPATISGKLTYFPTTSSTSSSPVDGGTVSLYDQSGYWVNSVDTAPDGSYTIDTFGLSTYYLSGGDPMCSYVNSNDNCLIEEFYQDKPDISVASPIVVNTTDLVGYNIALAFSASITGKVTYGSNLPAAWVWVCPYVAETFEFWSCAETDELGIYEITDLPNGTYRLFFDASGNDVGLKSAWLGASGPVYSYSSAATQTIGVKGQGLTNKNITLVQPPSISGTVTYSADGQTGPLSWVWVDVYNATTGDYVDSVMTNELGKYVYVPSGPGSFKLYVDPYGVGEMIGTELAPEWFGDVPDISLATTLSFTSTSLTSKNMQLAPPASISGRVTYLSGSATGAEDVNVCAYFSATADPISCGFSDPDGYYSIDGLPNGAYRLKFDATDAALPLTTAWLGSSATVPVATYAAATAQTISGTGASLINKNLQLAAGTLTTSTPIISGTPTVGSILTGNPGTWGPDPVTLTYEWRRGTTVVGTDLTYVVQAADVGLALTFRVTGSKTGYTTASMTSAAMTALGAWTSTPQPTITGSAVFGSTLTAVEGAWVPAQTSFTYQWLRNGSAISGATAKTYTLVVADVGSAISIRVTGVKSNYPSSPQTSELTASVVTASYTTTPVPTITGNANVGQTLTSVTGTWAPVPTSFTYQWRRGGDAISSATSSTYTLTAADLGSTISVSVTAVRSGYTSTTQTSASTATVAAALFTTAPVPTITGTVKVGSTVTAVAGTWAPVVGSYDYAWSSAATSTGTFTPIEGATSSTYTVKATDVGRFLKVTVTGKKTSYVDTQRTSVATAAVAAGTFATPPVPTITGTLKVGETLTAGEGVWSPSVDSYSYVWSSAATSSGTYAPISGATGKTYVLQPGDRGRFFKVTVTGVKAGFTSATSTASVASAGVVAPFTTAPTPTISGTLRVGSVLTATPGSWSPSATVTYQWRRNGSNITGATGATYVLTATDRTAVMSVAVTGSAATYETTTRVSADTTAVDYGVFATAPTPTITGSPVSGQTLTAVPGSWSPTATFTYRWFADADPISGATASTYVVKATDAGKRLSVEVTGSATGYTTAVRTSTQTVAVTLPVIASAPTPTISGTVKVGNTLTAAPGTLSGSTVKSYQWSWSATSTGTYADIPGATGNTYVIDGTYATRFVKVTVTWQKSGNADTPKTSNATTAVAAGTFTTPPVPTITGTLRVGQTLTANTGTWNPTPDSYTYAWSRANTATGTYTAISGATGSTYQLQAADLGKFLKVTVTGIKTGYTSTPSGLSAATSAVLAAI